MSSYIVKVEKDADLYCLWSTVTDSPHVWGTRAELEADHFYPADQWAPDRFARADKTGTSSMDGFFGWDDDEFVVMNISLRGGMLKRADLRKFLDSIRDNGSTCDASLLTPFEWDDEENEHQDSEDDAYASQSQDDGAGS